MSAQRSDRTALFVRLPAAQARLLDEHVRATGRPKQAVVADLIATELGQAPVAAGGQPDGRIGPGPGAEPGRPEILTLEEVAAWLRVPAEEVVARIDEGDLPARRFGDEWRFSVPAVSRWLEEADRPGRVRPGFGSARGPRREAKRGAG